MLTRLGKRTHDYICEELPENEGIKIFCVYINYVVMKAFIPKKHSEL